MAAFKAVVLLPVVAMLSTSWRGRGRPLTVDEPPPLLPPWFPRSPSSRTAERSLDALQMARARVDVARHRLVLARSEAEVRAATEAVHRGVADRTEALAALAMVVKDDEEPLDEWAAAERGRAARRAVPAAVAEERVAAVAPRYRCWRRLPARVGRLPRSASGRANVQ